MKKYPKGSEQFNAWNLKQLNYKVSANALYGCSGQYSSIFYNLYLCTTITGQVVDVSPHQSQCLRDCLGNNMRFESLTEVIAIY